MKRLLPWFLVCSVCIAQPPLPQPRQLPQSIFSVSNSATLRFSWKANSESDLDGYILRHRITKTGYDVSIGIPVGTTNYSMIVQRTNANAFSLTAVNRAGLESDPTAELLFPEPFEIGTNYSLIIRASPTLNGPWLSVSSNRIYPTNAQLYYKVQILRHQ